MIGLVDEEEGAGFLLLVLAKGPGRMGGKPVPGLTMALKGGLAGDG